MIFSRGFVILGLFAGMSALEAREPDFGQVNKRTLNFFLPSNHLTLPCFMPIEIKAAYNSYAGEQSLFGQKWTFNHNIRVKTARNSFSVLEGDGFLNNYTRERNLEAAKKTVIDQLLIARKKQDSQKGGLKAASIYEDYRRQLTNDLAFREEQERKFLPPRPLLPGKFYSFSRGQTVLEYLPNKTFVRTFQNNSKEYFDTKGNIVKSVDRNGNALNYTYAGDSLVRINDGCGRYMSFTYQKQPILKNLIDSIKDSIGREYRYEFFPSRRLKSFVDEEGNKTEYTYDKNGYMTSIVFTTGAKNKDAKPGTKTKVVMEYNDKGELVHRLLPDEETRYQRTYVGNNQSHSITDLQISRGGSLRGREVHEYKLREYESVVKYDAVGKEISKEITKLSPITGYAMSILDGNGNGDLFEYDKDTGNLMKRESVPAGDKMEFTYDPKCTQASTIKSMPAAGLASITTYKYDNNCNIRTITEESLKPEKKAAAAATQKSVPTKKIAAITVSYNKNGKIELLTDAVTARQMKLTYWRYGKPESITLRDSGSLVVKYDASGEILQVDTIPHGKGIRTFKKLNEKARQNAILSEVKPALDFFIGYLRPAGFSIGL